MDTEWDKKILWVVLELSNTRKEIIMFGFSSDTVLKDREPSKASLKSVKS